LFVVQRSDGTHFQPAAHIDTAYAQALRSAHQQGVEVLVYEAEVSPNESRIIRPLPWRLDAGGNPSEKTSQTRSKQPGH
jgi:sugar fermentation stimulation protein A